MSTATTTIDNFIGGAFAAPGAGATEEIHNPATGDVIASAPLSDAADVDAAVAAAKDAFDGWAGTVPGERALALLRIADALEERSEEICALESLNVGKPIAAMREEMPAIVDNLRFFAGAARVMEGKAAGEYLEGYTSMLRREAIGVVAQIAPWNYPL
ncbi:MAG: betaine-aldehyde dehydrogenase, partial [Solirubrobacteraceae bacterium]|nr:betaine-aldehyde dehydrogenase [Solirubrobacteraceae bacterium]